MRIASWFSCGAASATATHKIVEKYGDAVRVVYNPVAEEDWDNLRFLLDFQITIPNNPIEFAPNFTYPDNSAETVWGKRKFMSSPNGAPCTIALKKEARRTWEDLNHPTHHVFGFTSEETHRHAEREKDGMTVIPVLIDAGMSKQDCFDFVTKSLGLKLPRVYTMSSKFGDGYPNANCIGCVKATSPTYWNHVRCTFPEVFERREKQSREIGAKLVRCHPKHLWFYAKNNEGLWYDIRTGEKPYNDKGKFESPRIYLDELPEHVKAQKLKTVKVGCGIFCGGDE